MEATDRSNLVQRLEILDAYVAVADDPAKLIAICTAPGHDDDAAREAIAEAFELNAIQVDAVLAMQIRRFTPAQTTKIRAEADECRALLRENGVA